MSTAMLGGDVAQIQQGATAYRILGDSLTACGGQVVSTTQDAVATLQDQLAAAQAAVVSSVQAVSQESRSAISALSGTAWTGANRVQVEEVGSELDMRVAETTVRIQELFETFRAELARLGTELSDVATQFNSVAMVAGESAASLSHAMTSQAAQLEDVMNTGIQRV